ncbi:MAG TPA: carbohydrate kinase family protein [Candidatus Saccharimonadales bacterium]|nr:carbohydrate kinase family protein [Candidatus Saccharimonadales bacterium]
MSHNSQIDVLSIGDVVTDAFIKLLDDNAHVYHNEDGDWLSVPFATKVPYDHAQIIEGVGNAANASVSFARLGLNSGLVSNVGGDQFGRDIINALEKNDVDSRFIHINPGKVSNYHYVLWYKEERTILIKHEEYDYHWPRFRSIDIPKWVYFSSISKNSLEKYHDHIADWLEDNPEVKLAFQPGTFQMQAGVQKLHRLYKQTEVLILNREEAANVTGGDHQDVHDLLNRMHELGTKIAVITDGPDGAYASDSQNRYKMPPYPDPAPPFERTGAGDAFASTFVAALVKGSNIEGALQWAPINSMNVVQKVGAQDGLLTENQLSELLEKAPSWYKPEPF